MSKTYIALIGLQVIDADGNRVSIEPKSESPRQSGLFEHTFDAKEERRLIDKGVIRLPEGTEKHESLTGTEVLQDTRTPEQAGEKSVKAAKAVAVPTETDSNASVKPAKATKASKAAKVETPPSTPASTETPAGEGANPAANEEDDEDL